MTTSAEAVPTRRVVHVASELEPLVKVGGLLRLGPSARVGMPCKGTGGTPVTNTLVNINLPPIPGDQVKGVKVTSLGSRVFHEEIATMKDPWGREVHWIGGGRVTWSGGAESDFQAVRDGYISVTPLHVDMTNYKLLEVVRNWDLGK